MNVLKADYLPKQKRLQNRRQKAVKTFFSGYHTISNVLPPASCFKLPVVNEKYARNQIISSPKFPTSYSNIEESVEPKSIDTYSVDATRFENEIFGKHQQFCGRKDSTSSTSLEFHKILEPFLSFKQENLQSTDVEQFGRSQAFKEFGRNFASFDTTEEEYMNSIFENEDAIMIEQNIQPKTPKAVLPNSVKFNRNAFEQYSVSLNKKALYKK